MIPIASQVQTQINELKAQSLATMMSIVEGGARANGQGDGPRGLAGSSLGTPVPATIIALPEAGKIVLALPHGEMDITIPPALQKAMDANPHAFRPGSTLPVLVDQESGTISLILPRDAARIPAQTADPATRVEIKAALTGGHAVSLEHPVQRVSSFPAGTPGALVERLSGLAFPLAEAADGTGTPRGAATTDPSRFTRALSPPLSEAVLGASLKQGPIGPAISELIRAMQAGDLPKAAEALVKSLATSRLDGTLPPSPETLESALKLSGIRLEAALLKADGVALPLDLKASLLTLKGLLAKGNDAGGLAASPGAQTAPAPKDGTARQGITDAPRDLPRLVEGALERMKLSQIASLPEHHEMRITDDRATGFRIAASLPLAPEGLERPATAMIGLVVEHRPDGTGPAPSELKDEESASETEPFPWKVRIALDLPDTGPVEAEIRLRAQTVSITLWAEQKSTAALARAEIGALHQALEKADFDVSKLDVRDGRPLGPKTRPLKHLDRRS